MSETRFLIERSFRAAVAQFSATGAIPVNAATLAGLLLFLARDDARHAQTIAVPLLGASRLLLGAFRAEVDRLFDQTYAHLARVTQEERAAECEHADHHLQF